MTEEEKQELEALRQEKHQRTQTERARAMLEVAGVPGNFAALLVGHASKSRERVVRPIELDVGSSFK